MNRNIKHTTYGIKYSTVAEDQFTVANKFVDIVVVLEVHRLEFCFNRGKIHWSLDNFVIIWNLNGRHKYTVSSVGGLSNMANKRWSSLSFVFCAI